MPRGGRRRESSVPDWEFVAVSPASLSPTQRRSGRETFPTLQRATTRTRIFVATGVVENPDAGTKHKSLLARPRAGRHDEGRG